MRKKNCNRSMTKAVLLLLPSEQVNLFVTGIETWNVNSIHINQHIELVKGNGFKPKNVKGRYKTGKNKE